MRFTWVVVSLILAISCSQELIKEPEEPEPVIFTSSESICECYRSFVSIHEALFVENRLEYRQAFWELREECLTQFGTQLFYPSECNDPDYLDLLADSLRLQGIDINCRYDCP